MFLQVKVAGENRKKLLPETVLSYQKGISPMDVFIISQLSRSARLRRTWFWVRTKKRKQHHYKKRNQIRDLKIFNIINILTLLSADAKSATLLRARTLTKVKVRNLPLLDFVRRVCLVNGQLVTSLGLVKRSVICEFQCFCLFNIQHWSVLS